MNERRIGHTQARYLAGQFLQDDMPALQDFYETGKITDSLAEELVLVSGRLRSGIAVRGLLELSSYALRSGERGSVPRWTEIDGAQIVKVRLFVDLPVPPGEEPLVFVGQLVQHVAEIAIVSDVRLDEEI